MGCFLPCFGSKKERRRRKQSAKRVLPKDHYQRNGSEERLKLSVHHENVSDATLEHTICLNKDQENVSDATLEHTICLNKDQRNASDEPLEPTISLNKDCTETPITASEESRDELVEENLSFNTRKKVTFDLNVQTYEEVSAQEIKNYGSDDEKERDDTKESRLNSLSKTSYPSNHRYQNCSNSDDDYEAESEESDLDDDSDDDYSVEEDEDEHRQTLQEESSESFFSLPSAVQQRGSETPLAEKEVNSPLKTLRSNQNTRDRSHVHSVLNPVENLTQWKAAKMRSKSPLKQQQKENTDLENELLIPFSSEPTFRFSPCRSYSGTDHTGTPKQEDIAVDTSLSNWLGSSETTPSTKTSNLSIGMESLWGSKSPRSYSPKSREERPILGALTVEELRNYSATSSPRKSPSRSPDDMPIVGTVGSYWSHTGQASDSSSGSVFGKGIPNTSSKYREDKTVNWHTTPFETRLERALKRGEAEAYSS